MIKRRPGAEPARRRGWREGATAVEFAMIAGPLMLMIFATLELAMVFIVSTVSESALAKAAREIRTGQMQTAGAPTADGLKERACSEMLFLESDCNTNYAVDVRVLGEFSSNDVPDPNNNGEWDDSEFTFTPGGPNQIVLVRGFYRWPLITPFLSQALEDLSDGRAIIMSAETFRNEPYG